MGKFYLFVLPTPWHKTSLSVKERVGIESSSTFTFEPDDRLLLVDSKGADYEAVLAGVAEIVDLDRRKEEMILEVEKVYSEKVPIDAVRGILNRPLNARATLVTRGEFDAIISHM